MLNKEVVYFWEPNKKLPNFIEVVDLPYRFYYSDKNPDIIFLDYIPQDKGRVKAYRKILQLRSLYGWKPIFCMTIIENIPAFYGVDISLSYNPSNKKNIYWQFWIRFKELQGLLLGKENRNLNQWQKVPKTQFCNFIYRTSYFDAWIRENFCRLLSKYKRVDCPGLRLNNMASLLPGGWRPKRNFLAKYRFTIAFEHELSDYYITEKIMDAFIGGSIPIYWGGEGITEFFNPAAFVNCHDFDSFDDVVAHIKKIDSDPKLYQSYIQASPILPNSRIHLMIEEAKRRIGLLISKALKQRHRKESRLLIKIKLICLRMSYLHLELIQVVYSVAGLFGLKVWLHTIVHRVKLSTNRRLRKIGLKY